MCASWGWHIKASHHTSTWLHEQTQSNCAGNNVGVMPESQMQQRMVASEAHPKPIRCAMLMCVYPNQPWVVACPNGYQTGTSPGMDATCCSKARGGIGSLWHQQPHLTSIEQWCPVLMIPGHPLPSEACFNVGTSLQQDCRHFRHSKLHMGQRASSLPASAWPHHTP